MAKCLAEHVSIHTLRGILLLFSLNLFHFLNHHLSSSLQLLTSFVTRSKFLFPLLSLFKPKTPSVNPHETFCIFLLTLNPNRKIVKHHDTYFSIHALRGILLWFCSSSSISRVTISPLHQVDLWIVNSSKFRISCALAHFVKPKHGVEILTKTLCVFILILNPTTKLPHILPSISASAHQEKTPLILRLISLLPLNPVTLICNSAVSHKNKPDTNIWNLCYSSSLPSNPKFSPYKSRRNHFSNPRLLPLGKGIVSQPNLDDVEVRNETIC